MKYLSNIKLTIIVLSAICIFNSCKREVPKGKNIICVVDFSDCENITERLQFYKGVISQNIIPKLDLYDKITVIPVDQASTTNTSDILLKDLSSVDFEPEMASNMEDEELTKDSLKRYTDNLAIEFVNNFDAAILNRTKSKNGTDIFGALVVVKGKLKSADDNYVILLSDMMNWSKTLNMEPNNNEFNTNSLDAALNKVPNFEMPNTTVLVLTAKQVEASSEHFKLVQSFWTKYFQKNKIKLYDYNSASVAKLNELMALPVNE